VYVRIFKIQFCYNICTCPVVVANTAFLHISGMISVGNDQTKQRASYKNVLIINQ